MDAVYASLLDAVSALLFTETRRIAGQCLRKLFLRNYGINEFTDHRVLAGTDQVKILSLDLVHHRIHLIETHNAGYNIAADHERRDTVGKSTVNHEISCICDNSRMKSCDIAHQVIETISSYLSGTVQIDAVKFLHNLGVVRDLEIRYNRLAEALDLYVLAVVFTDRNTRINDVRDGHHNL